MTCSVTSIMMPYRGKELQTGGDLVGQDSGNWNCIEGLGLISSNMLQNL